MARFVTFRDSIIVDLDSVTWVQKLGPHVRINSAGQVLEVSGGAEELWPLLIRHFKPTEFAASAGKVESSVGHFMVDSGPS